MGRSGGARGAFSVYLRSAQVWAFAAAVSVTLPPGVRLGWWLPLHLMFLGAVSQSIVGGQYHFSTALTKARPASSAPLMVRLALMNVGAVSIALGRLVDSTPVLVAGACAFGAVLLWSSVSVEMLWRRSIARRFPAIRVFYLYAGASIVAGAAIGGALGAGAIRSGEAYVSHRLAHMGLNLLGWASLTILGTLIMFLPAVLHVRVSERSVRGLPSVVFGGLAGIVTGLSAGSSALAAFGGAVFATGLILFGRAVFDVVRQARPRALPIVARHLFAGIGWLVIVAVVQIPLLARGDAAAVRDFWVVGIGGGLVIQAVLGSWAFLLPMTRASAPGDKGRELIAFELGARTQVAAYNAGLALVLLALRGLLPDAAGAAGVALVWTAAVWMLVKTVMFPRLARLERVRRSADRWWAPRDVAEASRVTAKGSVNAEDGKQPRREPG